MLAQRLIQLLADQGGIDAVSTVRLSFIERFALAECLLARQEELGWRRDPAFDQKRYVSLLNTLTRLGLAIGVGRRSKPVPSLQEFIARQDLKRQEREEELAE